MLPSGLMSSSLPYHCDALLPTAERYASLKFRRYAQRIELRLLTWDDACELVAFVESIGGVKYARYIFHWKGLAVVRAYGRIRKHVGDVQHLIQANQNAFGTDVGLAVLASMRDGGWTRGKLPWIARTALKDLRKRGVKIADIAKVTGLSREQVKTACEVRSGKAKARRAAAFASLAG